MALVMNALTVSTMDKEVENKFNQIRAEADARSKNCAETTLITIMQVSIL